MRVGLGVTVWAKGSAAGHLDGIGVYTRALWHALSQQARQPGADLSLRPFAFGQSLPALDCGTPAHLGVRFSTHALRSTLLGAPRNLSRQVAEQVDLFHATDHHIPRLAGTPVVANVMDLIPLLHPEWAAANLRALKNWLFTRTVHSADHIITISEYSKRDLVEHLGIAPERISVTPLGVSPEYFEEMPRPLIDQTLAKLGLQPGFFLFIGTLQPRKNLLRVLQAHQSLPAAMRRQHPLVIVGRTGWKSDALLAELDALERRGEGRRFEYLPGTTVHALLQSAAALVFPSLYEGFGLPVIEAFAARCAVITSNTTSLPEVAGDAALLVDPTQSEAIAAAMIELLEQPENTAHRVKLGVERARQYSWDACARKTLDVYRHVGHA
ncbi:alpha-1,3-rhamnosyl/mannosyltransferase [Pseudomonas nitritireducens]|uniref:Alpha-1,3-rhamnosyl/mannosyltransferase n=1 Tax=Pseudomonas nitroreducens TaxID=46680 RepID=A0A7W7KHT8_PSENT|nr:glycosyltransferase family 1 protein [Pseudomonas nitritireducens]MBB4862994.1 alpha-1,3-rhamnosyl/mannosyltransferase [Pseudomonas nitritireducens]